MSLRARIAATASLSVALAVLVAALGLYLAVRSDLRGEIDRSLRQRAQVFAGRLEVFAAPPSGGRSGAFLPVRPSGGGRDGAASPPGDVIFGPGASPAGGHGFPTRVEPAPFGEAQGYVQFISPQGKVNVPGGQSSPAHIALSGRDIRIAKSGAGSSLTDRTVGGTRLRVLTLGTGSRGAVVIARPLTEINHELSRLVLLLAVIGGAGIALAAALGALVARTALAPIARFTRRAETLTGSLDLSQRLEVAGGDELARLAASFNATLDALERSVEAQRHLIADASHELRTPIASLRANIQVLGEAERLPPHDREALRHDVVQELDELTALVGDVVELARGSGSGGPGEAVGDVRLDEIVAHALERAGRRGGVRFQAHLEGTLVRGQAGRIDRAVSNLLENARRFSPVDGVVEVELHGGELTMRDHGPGFQEDDLPFVFDRFYRAEQARALPGSGLGLAIVRQCAEAHGGYAKAENAPGGGALLRVSFGVPESYTAPTEANGGT